MKATTKSKMNAAFALAVLVMATLTAMGWPRLVIPAGIITFIFFCLIFGVFRKQEISIDN